MSSYDRYLESQVSQRFNLPDVPEEVTDYECMTCGEFFEGGDEIEWLYEGVEKDEDGDSREVWQGEHERCGRKASLKEEPYAEVA